LTNGVADTLVYADVPLGRAFNGLVPLCLGDFRARQMAVQDRPEAIASSRRILNGDRRSRIEPAEDDIEAFGEHVQLMLRPAISALGG
jgi:hypothetical protein